MDEEGRNALEIIKALFCFVFGRMRIFLLKLLFPHELVYEKGLLAVKCAAVPQECVSGVTNSPTAMTVLL